MSNTYDWLKSLTDSDIVLWIDIATQRKNKEFETKLREELIERQKSREAQLNQILYRKQDILR